VGIAVGDHASGGVGGFGCRLMLFDDQYGAVLLTELECKGQPNDSGTDDDDIPVLHRSIVEQADEGSGTTARECAT